MAGQCSIGVRELKARASAVLREIQSTGEEIVITVHGRPIARLEPLVDNSARAADGMGGTRSLLAHLPDLDWSDFEAAEREFASAGLDDE